MAIGNSELALPPEVFPKRGDVYVIGVTGNIAAGKSTVDAMLAAKGAEVIDADGTTRDLQRRGEPAWKAILDRFGTDILAPDGELDRPKLGEIVFGNPDALRKLELIIHPLVRQEVRRRILAAAAGSVLVIDAIKLLESGMSTACHSLWAVLAPVDQQLARLQTQRAMPEAVARQRIGAQASPEEKANRADVVIDNAGGLDDLQRQVDSGWEGTAGAWLHARRLV